MKLYKNVSRFRVRRYMSKHSQKRIRWALSLGPGDLINDCTGFNVVIRKVTADICPYNNGWYICGVDFETEPFGGGCSLMHCGVEAPLPRDAMEKYHLEWTAEYMKGNEPGTMAYWFGGRDTEDFKKAEKRYISMMEAVQNGGHFLDERGVLLPEFHRT